MISLYSITPKNKIKEMCVIVDVENKNLKRPPETDNI